MILGRFLFLCFLFACGSHANNLMQRQSKGTSRSQGGTGPCTSHGDCPYPKLCYGGVCKGPKYKKLGDKACFSDYYGNYNSVEDAKAACSVDSKCQSVYDNECDNSFSDVHLCPIGSSYSNSYSSYYSTGSCIYEKAATYYLAQTGERCKNGYGLIRDHDRCNEAAKFLVGNSSDYNGWDVTSSGHSIFTDVPDNPYTAGCHWNNGGTTLWLNTHGLEAVCTGPQDCRTLCILDATCNDEIMNQDETDVDCGGASCNACHLDSRFIQECDNCGECKFKPDSSGSSGSQSSLGGGGHSKETCLDACHKTANCNFASRSVSGYCHMSQHCVEKSGSGWSRFRKTAYEATCNDEIMNQDETDVDCGGASCNACLRYVDDGCQTTGGADIPGTFQQESSQFGVRCCSLDGTSCVTHGSCPGSSTYEQAKSQCEGLERRRLCTKEELLSDVCCSTGAGCDFHGVWTSTHEQA